MTHGEIKGLNEKEAVLRLREFGQNTIDGRSKLPALSLLFTQYKNAISLVLLSAVIFSLIIRELIDAFFILVILIVNGLFSFFQEYRAEKTIEKLQNLVVPMASVIREGVEKKIAVSLLVPGDMVVIREGDRVPADGVLIEKIILEVDESVFTGESLSADKTKDDRLLAGSYVLRGSGVMKVVSTGHLTKLGQIAEQIKTIKKPKTPLVVDLEKLAKKLAFGAILLSFLLLPIGFLQNRPFGELVITAVSIAVAVIPEGLPLVVTIALAVGAYRMTKVNAVVRKMASIETLGAANVILTDKTGTLTENNMRVKRFFVPSSIDLKYLLRACVLGNSATISLKEGSQSPEITGDKTDGAFLLFAHDQLDDFEKFTTDGLVLSQTPFDPETKIIKTEWKKLGDGEYSFVRGAPESVYKLLCSDDKKTLETEHKKLLKDGLRVIAFAHKKKESKEYVLSGLLALYDPPRKEAKLAVELARKAGINIVMVTGDNPQTALHIGNEIGMTQNGDVVMTGEDLDKLTDEQLNNDLTKIRIFARMKPQDKLRLVNLYKKAGFIVTVTGDGVNDALALTDAHIGVAMGRSGTDVAREASDFVITDDNLYTIVRAIEEGRNIFANITKVVVYLVSSNIAEFLVIFIGVLMGLPIPLSPTQILWINLVSDGLPALALATDKKREGMLLEKPRNVAEQILSLNRFKYILKIAVPFSLVIVLLFYFLLKIYPSTEARFILFNIFVICELVIVFVVRGRLFPINKFLFLSVILAALAQVLIYFVPLLRGILS